MYEVTIPLRPVKDNEVGNPEEYFRIIREEYASRYLELLNIASTPANKSDFMRYRMMDDCDMMGIWPDLRTSALADAIRIVPPLRQRLGNLVGLDESDKALCEKWYGQADPISIAPPDIQVTLGTAKLDTEEDDRKAAEAEAAAAGLFLDPQPSVAPQLSARGDPGDFRAELERVKLGGNAHEGAKRLGLGAANARGDAERRELMKQELAALRAKFIFPFACERPAKEGSLAGPSKKPELILWPMEGPLNIEFGAVSNEMWEEVLKPIQVTLEDVKKNSDKWVEETMPLEFLTSRRDEQLLKEVRSMLREVDVSRLIGLLAHLLHWVAIMPAGEDAPQLSEFALQSLFVAIHKHWSQYEKLHRDSKIGVSFVLPCLMLALKRGVERSFEITYPTLMSHESLRQQVIDRINTLLMRLFDTDSIYTRFGKFDGEGKAIILSKKLDVMMAKEGTSHIKRLHGRMHRSTPLVRAVLGLAGTGQQRGAVGDSKTRRMMLRSDIGGTSAAGSVVPPPEDYDRQTELFKAAKSRLEFQGQPGGAPASARQSQGNRRHSPRSGRLQAAGTQSLSPRSARAPASGPRGEPSSPAAGGGSAGLEQAPALGSTLSSGLGAQPALGASVTSGMLSSKGMGFADAGSPRTTDRSTISGKTRPKIQLPSLRSANTQRGAS